MADDNLQFFAQEAFLPAEPCREVIRRKLSQRCATFAAVGSAMLAVSVTLLAILAS